jgi:small subunit ribosomal protein S8
MTTDTISDLLTRIRNAQRARHRYVEVRSSRVSAEILRVIRDEGFIAAFSGPEKRDGAGEVIRVTLKYFLDGRPAISKALRVSKPGRRVYRGSEELGTVKCGLGISIVSTSLGILTDREARRRKVGGEVMASVS